MRADESREVRSFVASLEAEATRLRRLGLRDGVSLEAVWDDAYGQLPSAEAEAYRRLGQHPAPSFTLDSAAAAIGVTREAAGDLVDALRDQHLLESTPVSPWRYRYHDLLRLHARRTGDEAEGPEGRAEVIKRVADFYVTLAGALDRAITPKRLRLAPDPAPLPEPITGPTDARTCFQAERSSILGVLSAARSVGLTRPVWQIAEALWPL